MVLICIVSISFYARSACVNHKEIFNIAGQVHVTYRSDHQGHKCDFAHLSLPRKHRLQIAGMLAAGIPMDDVIDQLQAKETKLTCLHFLTKSDLKNIMRDFKINKGQYLLHVDVYRNQLFIICACVAN